MDKIQSLKWTQRMETFRMDSNPIVHDPELTEFRMDAYICIQASYLDDTLIAR